MGNLLGKRESPSGKLSYLFFRERMLVEGEKECTNEQTKNIDMQKKEGKKQKRKKERKERDKEGRKEGKQKGKETKQNKIK